MMATARNPNTFSSKSILAQKVLLRASKTQAQSDILAAVSKWEPIASQIPKEHPDYEPVLSSYAVALLLKWEFTKDIKDIKKAIVTLEHALVSLEKAASRNRYQNLANLGAAYMDRWETFRTDGKDVLRAIECWEEAHTISMPLGLARESSNKILPHLAEAYFTAYDIGAASIEAVERSVKYFKIVIDYGPPEKKHSARYKLGQCYSTLYSKLSISADLDAAIYNLQVALEGELEREERQGALMELSKSLARRYDESRNHLDLSSAISWARIAVQENQTEAWILRNLANLLYWMFKDLKDLKALDEAIDYYEVIWALYQTNPGRSMGSFYYSFGTALMRRYDARVSAGDQGGLQDIQRAVDLMALAVGDAGEKLKGEYEHRLKAAIARHERASGHHPLGRHGMISTSTLGAGSPPSTMRSSNTVGFPSSPNSPASVSFAEQQELPPRTEKRRAPIPSLSSRPEAHTHPTTSNSARPPKTSTTTSTPIPAPASASASASAPAPAPSITSTTPTHKVSKPDSHVPSQASQPPSSRSSQTLSNASEEDTLSPLSSQGTILPMIRRAQTAPSLFSESMSFMTVPAVGDLPGEVKVPARPRVLRRHTKPIVAGHQQVGLTKPIQQGGAKLAPIPEKRGMFSFARGLRSPKAS